MVITIFVNEMKKLILLAAAVLAVAACQKNTQVEEAPKADEISIAPESRTFDALGGAQQVVVTSSADWTLTPADAYDWISPDITEGVDGDVVTFTAKENTSDKELSAVYTFTAGEATCDFVAVLRSAESRVLELTSSPEIEVPYTTEEVKVSLKTNVNYRAIKAAVESEAADWLSFRVALEGDGNTATMIFSLLKNEGRENRSGEITISADDAVEPLKVNVIQRAQPVITPEKTEYVLGFDGGKINIPVDANISYDVTVSYEEGTSEWLKYEGNQNGSEVFSAEPAQNNMYATVVFTESDPIEGTDPLVVSVSVRQTPPAIITKAVDMTHARAYPNWSDGTLAALYYIRQFTFEALIKGNDFKTAGSLSTIMGIEGRYLLRVGDSAIPNNRLQIASASNASDPAGDLETGKWYHVAVTFDNGHVLAYLNGSQIIDQYVGTASVNLAIPHNNEVGSYITRCFWVGYSYDNARDFRGLMSELRIWNKVLTEEEINSENHFYEVAPDSEGLLCYWKMNEGEGNIFKDATGNGNDMVGEINVRASGNAQIGDPGAQWVDVSLPE